ncbi:DoxX family protein [Pseudaminobacter sp. 19-2017]|uniref:DoxX family protein n=1 Tax=Pseudaminobacter soli (ex Zhang et al. 2022) TaxID=2831468 RepID=A0A942I6K9_9HYPH|nr:DoxX family protein [Pseudaminobacter soli]MBS3647405.1 DoxX family protein [Pseudaminobacter soli]
MSISATQSSASQSTGAAAVLVLGRLLISAMYIMAGFSKLTAISGTAQWFGSIGLPAPTLVAIGVGLVELVGGLAILIGFQTRIAAVVLALFTVAATLIAHTNFADMSQMLFFQKNLAITGGFLILAVFGPGALSIDARRG